MKLLYLTKSKKYTNLFLQYVVDRGHEVVVACKDYDSFVGTDMEEFCVKNNLKYFDYNDMYTELDRGLFDGFDLAISNNYGRLIRSELINKLNGNIINFHGAILPKYKGAFTYNWGLFNNEKEWGVTAHYVNERFDEGNIIRILKFEIDPENISLKELEEKTQKAAYVLSVSLIEELERGEVLIGTPQEGEGNYYSRADFERLKQINSSDKADIVDRKIHACWFPPYEGAYIMIDNRKYEVLPRK